MSKRGRGAGGAEGYQRTLAIGRWVGHEDGYKKENEERVLSFSSIFFIVSNLTKDPSPSASIQDPLYLACFPIFRACSEVTEVCLLSYIFLSHYNQGLLANSQYQSSVMPAAQVMSSSSPSTLPLSVPGKSPYHQPPMHPAPYSRVAVSPPQAGSSANTSAVPSLTSGSYAGSTTGDESSNGGASGIDLVELMNDRLSTAVNPLPLDKSLARQAQT